MAKEQPLSELAWAGWRTEIPADWRPLQISGSWTEGEMVIGNRRQSVVQINWRRPPHRGFSAERWLKKWPKRVRANTCVSSPGECGDRSIQKALRATVANRKTGEERTFWCCYSKVANLILECRTRPAISDEDACVVHERLMPTLRFSAEGDAVFWAVFNGCFRSPRGFFLKSSALHSGDLAILLETDDGRRLTMRQVYPADLALQRRELADWLRDPPFKEQLAVRVLKGPDAVDFKMRGESRQCVRRRGKKTWKRIFSFVRRYWFTDAAVRIPEDNRLYMAQLETRKQLDDSVLFEALHGMGRRLRDIE